MDHDHAKMDLPAIFSPCRTWRYTLRRVWGPQTDDSLFPESALEMVAFIGLNPSTADEKEDDPTVRRCINFAKAWGFGGMYMLNIFGYRSTDPGALYKVEDPIGPFNDRYITKVVKSPEVGLVIAAWGNHGAILHRGWAMERLLRSIPDVQAGLPLCRLGEPTNLGYPRHPLYLKGDLKPVKL